MLDHYNAGSESIIGTGRTGDAGGTERAREN